MNKRPVIGILASRADEASIHIAEAVLSVATDDAIERPLDARYRFDSAEVAVVDELHLDLEAVQSYFRASPNWIAIVSRHSGETGPLLTTHFPGNVGDADFGGAPRTVPPACPHALSAYLRAIDDRAPPGYDVGIECTHHGPTDSAVPVMFVEVGSDRKQWQDSAATEAVAEALWSVRDAPARSGRHIVGLGGGHYAPRFERVIRETDWDVGHIAPAWALETLEADEARAVLATLFAASAASHCLVDGSYPDLEQIVIELGHRVVSERWLSATSQLSVAVVDALERRLAPIDDGLTLGERIVDSPERLQLIELPGELVAECAAIDPDDTEAALAAASVAFTREDDRGEPDGRVAIDPDAPLDALLVDVVAILTRKYDDVEVTDDAIVATRRTFDPAAASAAGVPEGPLFGRLAAGESVTVDDRRIDPEDITELTTVSYPLPEAVRRTSD